MDRKSRTIFSIALAVLLGGGAVLNLLDVDPRAATLCKVALLVCFLIVIALLSVMKRRRSVVRRQEHTSGT